MSRGAFIKSITNELEMSWKWTLFGSCAHCTCMHRVTSNSLLKCLKNHLRLPLHLFEFLSQQFDFKPFHLITLISRPNWIGSIEM